MAWGQTGQAPPCNLSPPFQFWDNGHFWPWLFIPVGLVHLWPLPSAQLGLEGIAGSDTMIWDDPASPLGLLTHVLVLAAIFFASTFPWQTSKGLK